MNQPADNVVSELMPKDIEYQAAHWLAVLDGDNPSAEQIAAFHRWKNADEAHRQAFEAVLELWGNANILTRLEPPATPAGRTAPSAFSLFRPAAAFAILLLVSIAIVQPLFFPGETLYTTQVGEQKTIQLPDGSELILNTDSQIVVNYQSDHRLLTLQKGEAHFEVAHDPERPFDVIATQGRVRAIGTAFTVRKDQQAVSVYVTEGVVEVQRGFGAGAESTSHNTAQPAPTSASAAAKQQPHKATAAPVAVTVPAGQQAVYSQASNSPIAVRDSKDIDKKLSWREGKLVFNGEPLSQVIEEFGRYTDTRIIIPSKKVRSLKVGGIFEIGDTVAMLDALEQGFGIYANYMSDDIIYLVLEEDR